MNLQKTLDNISGDIQEVNDWADSQYREYFSDYFQGESALYKKLRSNHAKIKDSELEWILTVLPLELFSVSEQLSKLKTAQEVIKLHIKQVERDYVKSHSEGSETKRKEEAAALTSEDRLLVTVYDSIIERVGRQLAFSKELIMSAKKIWDARRSDGIPIYDIPDSGSDNLPEYKI